MIIIKWLSWWKTIPLVIMAFAALMIILSVSCRGAGKKPPGVVNGSLVNCPGSPNCVCSQDDDEDHRVNPLSLKGTPSQSMSALIEMLKEFPRTKVIKQTNDYLHVEFRTKMFRFIDDVEFLIDEDDGVIHIRSSSRVGYSDFGVNKKRVEKIREKWNDTDIP